MLDPPLGELATPVGERLRALVAAEPTAEGHFDVVGIPADGVAGPGEDLELVLQRGATVGDVEEVARVAVAGHERQGPLLAHATDQQPRSRDRLGVADRLLEPVAWPVERPVIPVPHVRGELQELLHEHEPFCGVRER